jgi:hypothetical protein
MNVPQYDIFRGRDDEANMWLECVDDLSGARANMEAHAKETPGPYFIACQRTNKVLASVDTSVSSDLSDRKPA